MAQSTNQQFGKVIRSLRKSKGFTQDELARLADLDRSYISLLERGLRSPTLDTMIAMCNGLGIELSDLFAVLESTFSAKANVSDRS